MARGVIFSRRHFTSLEGHVSSEFRATSRWSLQPFSSFLFLSFLSLAVIVSFWLIAHRGLMLLVGGSAGLAAGYLVSHVNEESIAIIHGLGIELKRYYATGVVKTKFLGDGSINAVLLHESIQGMRVLYAIAFVVQGEKRLTLCFKHVYPGLPFLRSVYDEATRAQRDKLVEPSGCDKFPPPVQSTNGSATLKKFN